MIHRYESTRYSFHSMRVQQAPNNRIITWPLMITTASKKFTLPLLAAISTAAFLLYFASAIPQLRYGKSLLLVESWRFSSAAKHIQPASVCSLTRVGVFVSWFDVIVTGIRMSHHSSAQGVMCSCLMLVWWIVRLCERRYITRTTTAERAADGVVDCRAVSPRVFHRWTNEPPRQQANAR